MTFINHTLALFGALALIGLAGCSDEKSDKEEEASVPIGAALDAPNEEAGPQGILGEEDWSGFDAPYNEQCLKSGGPDMVDAMPEICACSLVKIKENHSLSDIMSNSIPAGTFEDYGAQCTIAAFAKEGPYPEAAKKTIVDNCVVAASELGELAEPYCTCVADRLETEFTYAQVILEEITDEDYQRMADVCVAQVMGG